MSTRPTAALETPLLRLVVLLWAWNRAIVMRRTKKRQRNRMFSQIIGLIYCWDIVTVLATLIKSIFSFYQYINV